MAEQKRIDKRDNARKTTGKQESRNAERQIERLGAENRQRFEEKLEETNRAFDDILDDYLPAEDEEEVIGPERKRHPLRMVSAEEYVLAFRQPIGE